VATYHFQRSRSSKYQSATLRTSWLQVRVLPGVPAFALRATARRANFMGMWFNPNSRGSRLRIWQPWGCKSLHAHQPSLIAKREQGCRGEAQRRRAFHSPSQRASARQANWNVNRTSESGLGANECVLLLEDVAQVHGIPPISARVAQREQADLCRVENRSRPLRESSPFCTLHSQLCISSGLQALK
jgi:hypothetical protein